MHVNRVQERILETKAKGERIFATESFLCKRELAWLDRIARR
jgi:hypothetical protein